MIRIEGTYTALVTPFRNGEIDEAAFAALIEAQIDGGVTGIVPVGTTGESPTLDHAEHQRVIELAVRFANKRCQVIAGTGSNSTREAVEMSQEAAAAGVDAVLLVAPYYNRPTQEGLFLHFKEIATRANIPIVLYSIPSRCGVEIAVPTVARLAEACPNIVSIKESGGSVERVSQLRQALPGDFSIVSGDDSLTLPFLSVGAVGVISVASNIIPAEISALVRAWQEGRPDEAAKAHEHYYRLFKDLFIESNPSPIKTALSLQNRMTSEVRLPLCELSAPSLEQLTHTLNHYGLLPQ